MLPTLVYPLMIPALMSAMTLTTTLLAGEPIANDQMLSLKMLVAFDIVFSLLSIVFVDTVLLG
jgi:ABC-type transport system involved in cytochrome c biogenesis permease component